MGPNPHGRPPRKQSFRGQGTTAAARKIMLILSSYQGLRPPPDLAVPALKC